MENLVCSVEQGLLRGQYETNVQGGSFFSFVGIPYAKAPLGELRFKGPQPPECWEGIRDATKQGSPCHALQLLPTPETLVLKPMGSEDCLFLNVYTRQLPKSDQDEVKPVMMFIHGGAFIAGSSDRSMYGPEFLMTEDIVLVTINYRLGALGFLAIDDPTLGVTGNAGFKDMVQALKWIKNNIKQFGGDSDNVTIFGESAGGASVHYLVLSPLAKAIIQSASVLCPWAHGVNSAQKLAEIIGFTATDNKKILQFLQEVPVEKLVEGQIKLGDWLSPVKKRHVGPSVELESENAFLSEDPIKLINSGDYNQVPLMFGYTSLEGIFEEGSKLLGFQSNLEEFVPYYLGYQQDSDDFKEINKKILEFYYGSDRVDSDNKDALYL
ncbi:COesterase and/or Abhydrolase 3 domain containing protein, partial [Asbolus verrucosus]